MKLRRKSERDMSSPLSNSSSATDTLRNISPENLMNSSLKLNNHVLDSISNHNEQRMPQLNQKQELNSPKNPTIFDRLLLNNYSDPLIKSPMYNWQSNLLNSSSSSLLNNNENQFDNEPLRNHQSYSEDFTPFNVNSNLNNQNGQNQTKSNDQSQEFASLSTLANNQGLDLAGYLLLAQHQQNKQSNASLTSDYYRILQNIYPYINQTQSLHSPFNSSNNLSTSTSSTNHQFSNSQLFSSNSSLNDKFKFKIGNEQKEFKLEDFQNLRTNNCDSPMDETSSPLHNLPVNSC